MSQLTLARSYRPQRFSDVLGQAAPARALGKAAAASRVASSYIFSGTRGIGKTTLARIFAKALNCIEGPAEDCCDRCSSCEEIREGRSMDVVEMDAATHTGIDDIRDLREAARYPPSGGARFRVFILDEAHQLSQAAWNGLLKVLEEPPPWCVFLFCTTEPHKIPPTIESRSLHFAFRSPSPAQLSSHLAKIAAEEGLSVEDDALALLVKVADGSVRDGLSALDQVRALVGDEIRAPSVREALGLIPAESIEGYLAALVEGDAPAALDIVAELEREGQDLRSFASEVLDGVRRRVVRRALEGGERDEAELTVAQLVWIGRVLDELETRLRQGGAQRTLVDLATVRLTRLARLPRLEELVARLESGHEGPRPGRGGPGPGSGGRTAPQRADSGGARRPEPPARTAPESRAADPNEDLRLAIADQLSQGKSSLAAVVRRTESIRLDDQGRLQVSFPGDANPLWKGRLEAEEATSALAEAVAGLGLPRPERLSFEQCAPGAPEAPRPRRSREEIIGEACQDETVTSLFERFGAVIVDARELEDGAHKTED